MQCPYCISEIPGAAVVCPQCQRDLYLFRPLLEKVAELEKLQDRVTRLEQHLGMVQDSDTPLAGRTGAPDSGNDITSKTRRVRKPAKQAPLSLARDVLQFALLPALLLIVAHGVIVMLYDLKPMYLRVFSLVMPLPFGIAFASMSLHLGSSRKWLAAFICLGCAVMSVLGMSVTTHLIDHTPWLPTNARDAREFFEYAASIALSFATGVLIATLWQRKAWYEMRPPATGMASKVAKLMSDGHSAIESVESLSSKISTITGTAATVGAGVTAAYTGLRSVVGH